MQALCAKKIKNPDRHKPGRASIMLSVVRGRNGAGKKRAGGAMKQLLMILVMAVVLVVAYFVWDYVAAEARHREEVRQLQLIVQRLEAERRVAQVVVKSREKDSSGKTTTTLDFIEWDASQKRLPPITATVPGSEVYFEVLEIKFDHEYVEQGDALRGKTIVLFRRIFGADQKPVDGVPIDSQASDGIPSIYRIDAKPSAFEVKLWKRFWYYADHMEEVKALGVRVMQCKAVGGRLTPNTVYELTCEAVGGLNLTPTTAQPK